MSLLMIITFFLCMDQSILAPNLSDIARDFNMTDIEKDTKLGGELSLSFFIVAAPASLITGYYTDRVNRKHLFTAIILFGEVGCLICYWVEEYWQLLVLRLMTGIAVGGSGVLVASLIGDMYPPEERPRANMYAGIPSSVVCYYNQSPPLRNCNIKKKKAVLQCKIKATILCSLLWHLRRSCYMCPHATRYVSSFRIYEYAAKLRPFCGT